jgi:hypothetical protein
MWLLILPYVGGINQMAQGFCVSVEAPDRENGRKVTHALHMRITEDAQRLATLLQGNAGS